MPAWLTPVLVALVSALAGGTLTELVRGRAARAQAREAEAAEAREAEAQRLAAEARRLHEEQRAELERLRGRVDALEARVAQLGTDLLVERERASRHRIAAAELEAAARGCPAKRKDCPVLARAELLSEDGPQAQED